MSAVVSTLLVSLCHDLQLCKLTCLDSAEIRMGVKECKPVTETDDIAKPKLKELEWLHEAWRFLSLWEPFPMGKCF